jgi:hypothetical protein
VVASLALRLPGEEEVKEPAVEGEDEDDDGWREEERRGGKIRSEMDDEGAYANNAERNDEAEVTVL